MADEPLILALANPDAGDSVRSWRASGASRRDHRHRPVRLSQPGQQRPVLPLHLSRRARRRRNDDQRGMKLARVRSARRSRRRSHPMSSHAAYGEPTPAFGPDYLIPKPFDPRLILEIAPAVAKAAMESGVATRPIADFEAYHDNACTQFVFRSGPVDGAYLRCRRTRDPKRGRVCRGRRRAGAARRADRRWTKGSRGRSSLARRDVWPPRRAAQPALGARPRRRAGRPGRATRATTNIGALSQFDGAQGRLARLRARLVRTRNRPSRR